MALSTKREISIAQRTSLKQMRNSANRSSGSAIKSSAIQRKTRTQGCPKYLSCCAKCADVSSLALPNFVKSEPELYRTMPNTTINSLKKENDKLKDEITALRKSFGELQQLLQRHDEPPPNNGGHICSLNAETSTNLEFYGKSYDDLKVAQAEVDTRLQQLWSRLDALTARVEEMSIALEQFQRYSYQYNIKILGLPETTTHESASETSEMCLNLFKAVGVDISIHDIDIAHRIPTRNSTSGPRAVICKFTRRVIKEQVMNKRKDACKISSTSIGFQHL